MVDIAPLPGLAYNPFATLPEEQDRPDLVETVNAAFRLENDVVAATRLLTRPDFPDDPEFDLAARFQQSDLRYNYPEQLGRARSDAEFDAIEGRIRQELQDRETLAAAGPGGAAAAIAAGVASPTMFVPLTGGARGAKGVAQAFALAGAAGVGQEAFLLAAQETRTGEEAAVGIAAATVVGGLLGSSAVFMSARTRAKVEFDMANTRGEETISYLAGEGSQSAVRRAEFSPPIRNTDMPTFRPTAREGDTVMVFDSQGRPQAVQVDNPTAEGGAVFRDTDGNFQRAGWDVFVDDPRAPEARLDTVDGEPRVQELSDEQLVTQADELQARVTELESNNELAAAVVRDRTALLAEAQRRVREADVPQVDEAPLRAEEPTETLQEQTNALAVAEPEQPPLQRLADEADELPDAAPLRDADAPNGRAIGAAETSPRAQRQTLRRGPVSGWVIDQLSRLNPVTRTIRQEASPVASYWMARLSDAGLKTQDNIDFIAHAPEGTVEARALGHQAAVGQFIQEYDDAYARHVFGDVGDPNELRSAFRAHLASGFRNLPEGKLTPQEFGNLVYTVGSTGEAITDPAVQRAVRAQKRLYDYFRDAAEEAYQRRLEVDPDARRMFDPEGNLGPDVFNYIHQVYDIEAIVQNSGEFKQTIGTHAQGLQAASFRKAHSNWRVRDQQLRQQEAEARDGEGALGQRLRRIDEEEREIVNDPEFAQYERERDEIALELRDTPEILRGPVLERQRAFNEQRSDRIQGLQRRQRELNAERRRVEELQGMTSEERFARADELRTQRETAEDDFDTLWRERGAVDLNVERGEADFAEYGQEAAELLYNRMVGLGTRASGMEILGGPRGAELSRTLNLPFEQKVKWLNTDPEHTARVYARHMSTDVELYRATGSVNGSTIFDEVREDFARARTRLEEAGQTGRPLQDLLAQQQQVEGDLSVVISRLRHQRGIPDNPDGILYRLGRAAQDVNVTRLMGTVVLSSVPDLARPVMRSGLRRTFRAGYLPMLSGLSNLGLRRDEFRRLGVAWDPVMHNRTQAVFELFDDYAQRQTGIERGLGFLANKTGLVAGFDRWTAEMKQVSASVAASEFSDAIRLTIEGGPARQLQRARELLAAHGIEQPLANRIWDQLNLEGGSYRSPDGTLLPNTEAWTDYQSMAAYRAAVNKFVNDTIVTPGADRPSWMDANAGFKLLAQFRSFTFTSTNRVVLAGLQEQDMALMNGVMFSLAMGSVSYYLWAASIGGDPLTEANRLDPAKFADEAISRSGLLGVFSEAHRVAERIPGLQDYVTFSGQRTTRRAPSGLIGAVAGPSYDLAERVSNVVLGLDEPTQSTLHQARLMTPYQNVFWFRQLLDLVEEGASGVIGLPERREQ